MKKVYPVIHFRDIETTRKNLAIIINAGCDGVFMIDMSYREPAILEESLSLAREMGGPDFFVGVNHLAESNDDVALRIYLDKSINGIWVDNPGLYSHRIEAEPVLRLSRALDIRKKEEPNFQLFGSVAFKTQESDPDPGNAADLAKYFGWIPTTSGSATGVAAEVDKIKNMKEKIWNCSLAIASGITPENVESFLPYVDYFLVATGISSDFFNFDEGKVSSLVEKVKKYSL